MFKAFYLQAGAILITAAIAGQISGIHGALSAALGGAAYAIPSLLFALRLSRTAARPGASYTASFFVGEFIKIAATVGILIAAQFLYRDLSWGAMLAGLFVALQTGFFAFLFKT